MPHAVGEGDAPVRTGETCVKPVLVIIAIAITYECRRRTGTELAAVHLLCLMLTVREGGCCNSHFTDKETEASGRITELAQVSRAPRTTCFPRSTSKTVTPDTWDLASLMFIT